MPQDLAVAVPADAEHRWALDHLGHYGRNSFSTCLLYDGVEHFRCHETDGFVGYLRSGPIEVAVGEPVCPASDYRTAVTEFIRHAESRGKACVFVGVGETFRSSVRDLAFTSLPLGEDTGIAEPSYLLKYPAGIGIRDLLGILRAFHVL